MSYTSTQLCEPHSYYSFITHSPLRHSLTPPWKLLSLFLMTPSSRHRNPCIYARNHSYRYGSPCVYSRQHRAFSLGDLVFMPDSISMTGLKVSMILSLKPLVYSWQHIPGKYRFSSSKSQQKRRHLVVFSAHCGGLTLGNSFGAFRHKQDSTLDIQITQYVVVSALNSQNIITICSFFAYQCRLHSLAILCGFISSFINILFPSKVPAGINSAESQNYG